nr:uncharacterized protein LOC109152102 [Ipomoea batatas]
MGPSLQQQMAEAMGCREAPSWIKGRGITKLCLETQALVNELSNTSIDRSLLGNIIHSCKRLIASLKSFSCIYIRRTLNQNTHTPTL